VHILGSEIRSGSWIAAGWRLKLSFALLLLAAIPLQIHAVPGFEITPSLVLAPVSFLLFQRGERMHFFVVLFLLFCMLLALVGVVRTGGGIRNLIGAASYSSGAPYLLVGMVFARRNVSLSAVWLAIAPVGIVMTLVFIIDLYLTNGNLLQSTSYESVAYTATETTIIKSFFPFYGKYGVITLSTITMVVGALLTASAYSFNTAALKVSVLVLSGLLVFLSFSMWSRQVMVGVLVFYMCLIVLAFRSKETWIAVGAFLVLLLPWFFAMQNPSWSGMNIPSAQVGNPSSLPKMRPDVVEQDGARVVTADAIGRNKIARGLEDIASANFDDLTTGRLALYTAAIGRISKQIILVGCGFCSLTDVMRFPFSSLHNVILTAVFKGGIIYAALYLGAAFCGCVLLFRLEKSFARDVSIAVVWSVAVQSMVNDVLYFQVIPALLFVLAGYVLASGLSRRRFTF
jgi:hypothetical protein